MMEADHRPCLSRPRRETLRQGPDLLLVGGQAADPEPAAGFPLLLEEGDAMSPCSGGSGRLQTCRTAADNKYLLGFLDGFQHHLPLPTRQGIDAAEGVGPVAPAFVNGHDLAQAAGTGDAGDDFIRSSLPGLVGQLWVGQEGPGHADEVCLAGGQDLLGGERIVDPVGGDDRDAHDAADRPGQMGETTLGHGGGDGGYGGFVPARVGVDEIHPRFFQCPGDRYGLGDGVPPGHLFVEVQADPHGEILADGRPDGGDYLPDDPQPVFQAAAVFILPEVGEGGEEAIQEVAATHKDLQGIESPLPDPAGGAPVSRDDGFYFRDGQGPRRAAQDLVHDGGRAHSFGGAVSQDDMIRGDELAGGFRPVRPDGRRQPPHPGQKTVGEEPRFRRRTGGNGGKGDDDQAGPPFGPGGEESDETVADGFIGLAVAGGHGQHDDPVPQLHLSDLERGEQMLKHGASSRDFLKKV